MDLGKKISFVRKAVELTQVEFSEIMDIPLSTLKKYETGNREMGAAALLKVTKMLPWFAVYLVSEQECINFRQYDAAEFIKSELKKYPLKEINKHISEHQLSDIYTWDLEDNSNSSLSENPIDHIQLPFYEMRASAGAGVLVEVEDQIKTISFEPSWLRKEVGVNPNDAFLMLVKGDSMYPTLKNESMIMVDKNLEDFSDGIYVIRHDNNLLVKRLQLLPGGIIKVKSDNTMYEPWEINKSQLDGTDLELIGRVVWTGQRM